MVRFIHTADWQLGMTRHYLGGDAQPRFSAARIDVIRSIGALALDQGCPFVVVCGDVFETNHVERQVVVRALDAMAATPQITFYLLPGNHDPLDASSVFRSQTFVSHRPANVVVLESTDLISPVPGVEVVPAPWTSKRPLTDLVGGAVADLVPGDTRRIVVGHGALDVLSPDDTNPALVALAGVEAALADGRIHYLALGDRHSATSVGRTGCVRYSGAPEPTDFREVDPGQVLVVELDESGRVAVEAHRVGTWHFVRHEANLTGHSDVDLLDSFLDTLADKARTIVRLSLVGQLSLTEKARLDSVLAHHGDLFASLQGWERRIDLLVLPDDTDLDSLGLSGFALDALADLQALAAPPGESVVAQDAMALLARLAGVAS